MINFDVNDAVICNGKYNGDKCRSNNFVTLVEWCCNTKETVSFDIHITKPPYKNYHCKFEYAPLVSEGQYFLGRYSLQLRATITDDSDDNKIVKFVSLIDSEKHTLSEAEKQFYELFLKDNRLYEKFEWRKK